MRCKNGTRRNKKTGECEPHNSTKRCPNGTRRNKKTKNCESTKIENFFPTKNLATIKMEKTPVLQQKPALSNKKERNENRRDNEKKFEYSQNREIISNILKKRKDKYNLPLTSYWKPDDFDLDKDGKVLNNKIVFRLCIIDKYMKHYSFIVYLNEIIKEDDDEDTSYGFKFEDEPYSYQLMLYFHKKDDNSFELYDYEGDKYDYGRLIEDLITYNFDVRKIRFAIRKAPPQL
jgi:hypothetical protein